MRNHFFIRLCLLLLPTLCATAANQHFIAISDLHLNPYWSCQREASACPVVDALAETDAKQWDSVLQKYDGGKLANYLQDTNYTLFINTLKALKQQRKKYKPTFVLVLGDMIGHHLDKYYYYFSSHPSKQGYQQFILSTLTFIKHKLQQALPGLPIYFVCGNNDTYGQDYSLVPKGKFFRDNRTLWQDAFKHYVNKRHFLASFQRGGYYQITMADNPKHKLLVLNTVMFSDEATGPGLKQAARLQLYWLKLQLRHAKKHHQQLMIAFHIPVGIDIHKVRLSPMHTPREFLYPRYTKQLLALFKQYSSNIRMIFAGHIHADSFNLIETSRGKQHTLMISLTPATSPIFGNNPGFKVYQYDPKTFVVNNYDMFYLPLDTKQPSWTFGYRFNEIYQPDCKDCDITKGAQRIRLTGKLAKHYERFFPSNQIKYRSINLGTWRPFYFCAIRHLTREAFKDCVTRVGK